MDHLSGPFKGIASVARCLPDQRNRGPRIPPGTAHPRFGVSTRCRWPLDPNFFPSLSGLAGLIGRAFCVALALLPSAVSAQTVLERVLPLVTRIEALTANSVFANIAETVTVPNQLSDRRLSAGDRVVTGYATDGTPTFGVAGLDGLTISQTDASRHDRGLPPGFYPNGSLLFQLAPGAQLSLFNEAQDGALLAQAQELALSRIDGRITTQLLGLTLPEELTAIAAVSSDLSQITTVGNLQSTTLGAVNTGEIVTNIQVDYVPTLDTPAIGFASSRIATGYNAALDSAATSVTEATAVDTTTLGGSAEAAVLALNIASNMAEVTGAVMTHIQGRSASVGTIVTTVLGAVNGGVVSLD